MNYESNTSLYRPRVTPVRGRLAGRNALITGAARGIGRAIAERFLQEGAAVAITDIDGEGAAAAAAELDCGGVALSWKLDVSNRAEVESVLDEAAARMGGVDILVNNAGVIVFGSLMECSIGDWERMMAVDLTGALHCTQVAARLMIGQGRGGRLIHIGSTASLLPTAQQAAYCVAKSGLRMLSKVAAMEFVKHGITSNLLCPEGAVTEINRELLSDPAVMGRLEAMIPAGRMGTVEEIAALAAFVASSEADYITGAELVHDGGAVNGALWWR
ncbi:MAG: SDR family oxidoreductase [Bryobacterales bacterium]|nr:SDR family oxidoreductase [Bryobacterales bacterium]